MLFFITSISIIIILFIYFNYLYKYTHVFGCRKPNTKIGSWNGAYVFVKDIYGNMRMAVFEDNNDFIGYPNNINHGKEIYNNFIHEHKWIKMSNEDIYKTSGVKVSYFTNTNTN